MSFASADAASDDGPVPPAAALHHRAVEELRAGRFPRARTLLERALAQTDDVDLTARIELSLAYVDAMTGSPDEGRAACEALLDVFPADRERERRSNHPLPRNRHRSPS